MIFITIAVETKLIYNKKIRRRLFQWRSDLDNYFYSIFDESRLLFEFSLCHYYHFVIGRSRAKKRVIEGPSIKKPNFQENYSLFDRFGAPSVDGDGVRAGTAGSMPLIFSRTGFNSG